MIQNHFNDSDPNCIYNANSVHLRCAVNPTGTCLGCQHYQENNSPTEPIKNFSDFLAAGRKLGCRTIACTQEPLPLPEGVSPEEIFALSVLTAAMVTSRQQELIASANQ